MADEKDEPELTADQREEREALARFAELGFHHVDMLFHTGGIPPVWHVHAIRWLAKQKEARDKR